MKSLRDFAHRQLGALRLREVLPAIEDARPAVCVGGGLRQRELQRGMHIIAHCQQRHRSHQFNIARGDALREIDYALVQHHARQPRIALGIRFGLRQAHEFDARCAQQFLHQCGVRRGHQKRGVHLAG